MSLKEFIQKLKNFLYYLFITLPFEQRELRFIRHNRKTWPALKPGEAEVLVEVFPIASAIIAQSYLTNFLANKYCASIVGYTPNRRKLLKSIYNYRNHRIYRSFNTSKFLYISPSAVETREAQNLLAEILPTLKNKKHVEDLMVDGVWIGDLLYDSHLMKNRVPTVEIQSASFRASLLEALCHFIYWRNYLCSHNVKAILVSHCGYFENATILRLGIKFGIPVYQATAAHCYYLSERQAFAYKNYLHYPQEFKRLSLKQQQEGLAKAKERLDLRFQGAVGVDMHYSTKSAYTNVKNTRILRESSKIKVLIATHCFFDSPHGFGNNLFPDFYEWIDFLGKISDRTDYDWYIKTHPDVMAGTAAVISSFMKKYPRITLLPADSSHLQMIREGLSVALTVFGTIGMEYAALNVPVINVSSVNPHVGYNFNLHMKSIDEYEKTLLNLKNLKLNIDKNEVYEYYYMRHLYRDENWLFPSYEKFISVIGGYAKEILPDAYEYFVNEFTSERHAIVCKTLQRFVESKDYCLKGEHIQAPAAISD